MAQKGLNSEIVIKAAAELIEKEGMETFSMRLLADFLGIKTASLYNHVESMDGLIAEICRYALRLQKETEMQTIEGKHGEDAVRLLADAYRSFAKKHRELYWLIMNTAARDNRVLDDAATLFTDPLKKMLEDFHLSEEKSIHYRRLFRAIVHGFVSQEDTGFFSHYPMDVDKSFHFAVQCYINSLRQEEKRKFEHDRNKKE